MCFPHVLLLGLSGTADWIPVVGRGKQKSNGPNHRGQERGTPQNPVIAGGEASLTDTAFERWLREKLEILYGPVADEPIPDDLRKIIASFMDDKKD